MDKPFRKYNFFLDLKNSPQLLNTLSENITSLGGRIESFLSRNVKYVVTNRPKTEWPQKNPLQSPTPSIVINTASFSRGKMLLAKSAQNLPKTTDTLELARNWNIKIILANDMLEFCKKHLRTFQEENKSKTTNSTGQNTRQLLPPFIKVMDNSLKYKSNFKELAEWPEINFDFQPELCPFLKRRDRPVNPTNATNISQQSNKSLYQIGRFNDKCTVLTTPIMTTNTLNVTGKSIPTKTTSKRKHVTFCEICHKEYDDFEMHLADETHSTFLSDNKNFTELLSVIQSLPSFIKQPVNTFKCSRFISNGSCKKGEKSFADFSNTPFTELSNLTSNEDKGSKFFITDKRKKSVSPPIMRSIHSINTWSSASKSRSFVALHDLINKNDEVGGNENHTVYLTNEAQSNEMKSPNVMINENSPIDYQENLENAKPTMIL